MAMPNKKRIAAGLLAACLLSVGCAKQPAAKGPAAPPEVEVTQVVQKDVPISQEWVANVDGFVNAQIQPQVSGYLLTQNYKEGSFVQKGQVLFEIDPRPFQASLDQAQALVEQAKAQEANAQQAVDRDTPLAEARAIARKQLESDVQMLLAAQAAVRAQQAQVEIARINIRFAKVRSLIDGIAGIAAGQIGNLVGPSTILTTVSQVDPIKVYFALGESEYLEFAPAINNAAKGLPGPPAAKRPVELLLADGTPYGSPGELYLADRQIDPQTGTIRVAALFPNPKGTLRPGQFGRIRAQTRLLKNALLIPQMAVTEIQGTYQVAVLGSGNKAEIRPITVGPRIGADWVVEEGLKPQETIIVQGMQRVRAGLPVQPTPYQAQTEKP
jgi:membrane fusion protein (multidrug efflux system)